MQAASEAYTTDYLEAEEAMGIANEAKDIAVRTLREYKAQVRESLKESRKALWRSGANSLGQVQRDLVQGDIGRIESEIER